MRRHSSPHSAGRFQQRGYALLLMLVLVTMGILFTVVSQLSLVGMKWGREYRTHVALLQAKEALIGYAATYGDTHSGQVFGYLPCPDQTTVAVPGPTPPPQGNGYADNTCGSHDVTAVGLLPYNTLGLEDLRDSTGVCLWYVVSGTFKNSPNSSGPMNWDTQGQINVIDANGNTITAAAAVIATGPPAFGQTRTANSGNVCGSDPTQIAAYIYSTTVGPITTLKDGQVMDSNGRVISNNRVLAITPKEIFNRIIERADFKNPLTPTPPAPPGMINSLTDKIRSAIETQIQADLIAGATGPTTNIDIPDTATGGYSSTPTYGKLIGDPSSSIAIASPYDIFYTHWRSQYRYAICSSLTGCMNIADNTCRGVLMFAGQSVSEPRGQIIPPSNAHNLLSSFFENSSSTPPDPNGGLDILNSSVMSFPATGNTSYLSPNTTPSSDVATCIFPGDFVTFAQNIADFAAGSTYNSGSVAHVYSSSILEGSSGGGADSGCIWDKNALQFTKSLRLYFRVNFAVKGNGFTMTLADGATNLAPDNISRSSGQIMCGTADSGSLGYAGIPPSGSTAGINSPKLGIEFDTHFDSNRNDPHADHAAFLFWGTGTDNVPSGIDTGNDDATHYVGTGGMAITGATWSGGIATLTTSAPHGLVVSPTPTVLVSGVTPNAYNGTYAATVLNSTQFQVSIANNPGTFVSAGMVKPISAGVGPRNPRVATAIREAATNSNLAIVSAIYPGVPSTGNQVVIQTAGANRLVNGDTVYIYGVDDPLYNGIQQVVTCDPLTPPSVFIAPKRRYFCYVPNTPPSAAAPSVTNATVVQGTEISSLNWSNSGGGAATATSPNPLPFHSTSASLTATIFGVTPSAYDITPLTIAPLSSPNFSYSFLAPSPGSFSTENPSGMFLLGSPASPAQAYFNYLSIPTSGPGTPFYVRLDITRSYDSTNNVAVLNLKAYISDFNNLPAAGCSSAAFQNMTDDLATLCPSRKATLQQDSIPVNAIGSGFISLIPTPPVPPQTTTLVTATTSSALGVVSGTKVTISGVTPALYNGTYTVTVTGPNTYTYSLNNNPGINGSGGGIQIQPLSTYYIGFTNSRGSSSPAEDQSVTIDQLILRSQ